MGEWCASQTPHLTQDHLADHKQQTYQTNQTHINRPPVSRVSQTGFHRRAQWGYGLSKNRPLSSFHKFFGHVESDMFQVIRGFLRAVKYLQKVTSRSSGLPH